MAKRDFANVHSPAKKKPYGKSGLSAAMAAVSLLLTAVVGFSSGYMTGDKQNASPKLQAENKALKQQVSDLNGQIASLNTQLQTQMAMAEKNISRAKHRPNATQQVGDLTFYSSLPKQKVMPSPLGDEASQSTPQNAAKRNIHKNKPLQTHSPAQLSDSMAKPGTSAMASYRLQLASYIRRSDAEGFVNRLMKSGLSAQVNEKVVEGVGVRYRVVMGPFHGLAAAEAAHSDAREKMNVDGLLLRE